MPCAAQPAEEFDDTRIPPCNIRGQFFQQCHGSFTPAIVDRLGDVQPLAASVRLATRLVASRSPI